MGGFLRKLYRLKGLFGFLFICDIFGRFELGLEDLFGFGENGVSSLAGSFVNYEQPFEEYVAAYAQPVRRRKDYVADYASFAEAYVDGFKKRLAEVQVSYRSHKAAFDELFSDRPYDTNGSGAYRWACALRRLDACDPQRLFEMLKTACGC